MDLGGGDVSIGFRRADRGSPQGGDVSDDARVELFVNKTISQDRSENLDDEDRILSRTECPPRLEHTEGR